MPPWRIPRRSTKGRNTWTDEQREVLHVLCTQFNLDWATRALVFNKIFEEHQRVQNIVGGLSKSTLAAQYTEREKKPKLWQRACQDPTTDEEWRLRHELTAQIQRIALDLNSKPIQVNVKSYSRANSQAQRRDLETDNLRSTRRALARVDLSVNGVVGIEEVPSIPTTPHHRSARSLVPKTPPTDKTIEYVRTNGVKLMLTPRQYEHVQRPLVPVSEAIARPAITGLFFRYWDEKSFGTNSERGFLAGRFPKNNVRGPVPRSADLVWEDLKIHIGGEKIPTPFISVANSLVWTIRKALQQARKGMTDGKITLIDAGQLEGRYYHLLPYDIQLCKRYAFTGGKMRFVSKHEFICWREIPETAILHTFSLRDLLDACQQIPHLEQILRFDILGSRASFVTKVVASMRQTNLQLIPESVVAIAYVCRFLGFNLSSQLRHIEHIVADIVSGWSIIVPQQPSDQWIYYAALFTQTFCGCHSIPTFTRQHELSTAFLFGLRLAHGGFNAFHSTKKMRAMHRKATASGLEAPARIISDALANASAAVLSYEEDQNARYEQAMLRADVNTAAAVALPEIGERFRLSSDVTTPTVETPLPGVSEYEDEIMYDEDVFGL